MSSLFRRFLEAFKKPKAKADTATPESSLVEWPEIGLDDILRLYYKDPMCKACVDSLASQAVGVGFYTTYNPDYYRGEKAKDYIDSFCEKVGLDQLLLDGAKMLIACGNEFWLKITPKKFEEIIRLPPDAITKINVEPLSEEIKAPYKVKGYLLKHTYGGQTLTPEAVVHFRINTPPGRVYGVGFLQVLLERFTIYGATRPSLAETKAKIETILPRIFEKYAGPDVLALVEDATDEDIASFKRTIKSRPPEGAWLFYTGKNAKVEPVQIDPRARFEYYIDHIIDQYIMGLETPLPKLFTRTGYTEASAKVAKEFGEAIVKPIQRCIKRTVEREIFKPLLEQAGFDPEKAGIRLNWGAPSIPQINMDQMLKAAELGIIRPEEFRKNAAKMGWELWEPQQASEEQPVVEKRKVKSSWLLQKLE